MERLLVIAVVSTSCLSVMPSMTAANVPGSLANFVEGRCLDCHDSESKKGGFDLSTLNFDLTNERSFAAWVKVHDRVSAEEMPPKKEERPQPGELSTFLPELRQDLIKTEIALLKREGRATQLI